MSRAGGKKTSCSLFPRPLRSRHTQDGRRDKEGVRMRQAARRGEGDGESDPVRYGRHELAETICLVCRAPRSENAEWNGLMIAVRR